MGAPLAHFVRGLEQAVHRAHATDEGALIEQRRVHRRGRRIVEARLVQDGERGPQSRVLALEPSHGCHLPSLRGRRPAAPQQRADLARRATLRGLLDHRSLYSRP